MGRKSCILFIGIGIFLISSILPSSISAAGADVDWWSSYGHSFDNNRVSMSKGPRSSQLLWTYTADSPVRSSAAVVDGVVYCGGFDGTVFAINANTGIQIWKIKIGVKVWASPTVVNGRVYIGNMENGLFALNAATGETVWTYSTASGMFNGPTVTNGVVYQASNEGTIYAIDETTGALKWSFKASGEVRCTPSVVDGVLYFGSTGVASGAVYALRATDGHQLWSYLTGPGESSYQDSSPAVVGGVVFIGSSDGFLYALEASSGAKKWSFQTGGKVSSSPAVLQGVVYVGSEDGKVYALSDSTGAKIWEYSVGSPVYSSPSLADGVAYIGAYGSSMILALDASNGSLIWDYQAGNVFASPSIANGVVYVGTYDNKLYAFGVPDTTTPSTQYALTTTVIGEGSISRSPDKPLYNSGESVQISAIPSASYDFTGWEGDQTGIMNPATITMEQNKTITATFTKKPSTNTSIITSKIQNGTSIASSRITIDFQNQNPNTTNYEIKVDEGTWLDLGTSTAYTASGLSLGEHNIEVRAIDESGAVIGSEKVNFEVSVWVPPVDKAVASSVVIVGTLGAISIIATAISNPLSMPFTWLWEKINALLPDSVKGWLESFISSKRQLVIESKQGPIYILSRIEIFAYLVSLVVMTCAFAYSGAGSLGDFILLIPTVLATSVIVGLTKNLITEFYARTLGVWAEHRLWYLGLTTFLFSTIIFKTPFSSPSRIVNHSPNFTPRSQGLVASASVVISLAFGAVFYALLLLGYTYVGSIGLGMCILGALFDTLPIAPMNGRDIYDWNVPVWVAQFILTLTLYAIWLMYI